MPCGYGIIYSACGKKKVQLIYNRLAQQSITCSNGIQKSGSESGFRLVIVTHAGLM